MKKNVENAVILSNENLVGDYFLITFSAKKIAESAKPGQFVHLQIPFLDHRVLRRPFSIYNTDAKKGTVSVIYKVVGEGTKQFSQISVGTNFSAMGALGNGFSIPQNDEFPIIVAGGYGCAATFMQAKIAPQKGVVIIGGRSKIDLLLLEEFAATGFTVLTSTNDGSFGEKGLVTDVMKKVLEENTDKKISIYSCGPNPMLKAVGDLAAKYEIDAELSIDEHMCCGVGACFTCVCKEKTDKNADGWFYSRTCLEGPVYSASKIKWD